MEKTAEEISLEHPIIKDLVTNGTEKYSAGSIDNAILEVMHNYKLSSQPVVKQLQDKEWFDKTKKTLEHCRAMLKIARIVDGDTLEALDRCIDSFPTETSFVKQLSDEEIHSFAQKLFNNAAIHHVNSARVGIMLYRDLLCSKDSEQTKEK